jgi:hypothetical protein
MSNSQTTRWRYVLALVIWGVIVGTFALQYSVHRREAAIAEFVEAMRRVQK